MLQLIRMLSKLLKRIRLSPSINKRSHSVRYLFTTNEPSFYILHIMQAVIGMRQKKPDERLSLESIFVLNLARFASFANTPRDGAHGHRRM